MSPEEFKELQGLVERAKTTVSILESKIEESQKELNGILEGLKVASAEEAEEKFGRMDKALEKAALEIREMAVEVGVRDED